MSLNGTRSTQQATEPYGYMTLWDDCCTLPRFCVTQNIKI